MDVDSLMDLANTAVEGIFGRLVTYTPVGSSAVSDPDGLLKGDYQTSERSQGFSGAVEASGGAPRIDFRKALLDDFGITPTNRKGSVAGDVLSFAVGGETHTYEVIDILPSAPESVVLVLGRRGE